MNDRLTSLSAGRSEGSDREPNVREPQVVRLTGKEKAVLLALLMVVAFGALALFFIRPKFVEIYLDVFGDDAELSYATALAMWGAKFWLVVPFGSLLLHLWSQRRNAGPRSRHRVWWLVMVVGFACLVLMVLSLVALCIPLSHVGGYLQP